MFESQNIKYALIIGNSMKGCYEDIRRLKMILNNYNFIVKDCIDVNVKDEIMKFIDSTQLKESDLFYIHFSGHGIRRGKTINNKCQIVSCWLNPDKTYVTSDEIDEILSKLPCSIILTSDSCHGGQIGMFYKGSSPFISISTSTIGTLSNAYKLNNDNSVECGLLVNIYEYLISNNMSINVDNIIRVSKIFISKHSIKKLPKINVKNQ